MKTARGFMKMMIAATVAFAAAGPAYGVGQGHIDKMDTETHTLVINKLELAIGKAQEDETVSLRPVRARLADLYAERARLRAMDEAERNCSDCTGAQSDRTKAIKLYESVVKEAPKASQGPLLIQMAHLNELSGNIKKSAELYERVLREGRARHDKDVIATAHIGRAESRFAKADFKGSKKDFETAMKMVKPARRGAIMHRIAWCELNQGEQPRAVRSLVKILDNPEFLLRDSTQGPVHDLSFQEDVARDLATFMARGPVTNKDIALVERLAPERAKRETLKHFASECERLGQKPAAVNAWAAYAKYETNPHDRLEVMVRVAQVQFDLGQKPEALKGLREATSFWAKNGCQDKGDDKAVKCSELQERLRHLVATWHRTEKKNPSKNLLEAYLAYLSAFRSDLEMTHWAADVAREQKNYSTAGVLYHQASLLVDRNSQEKKSREALESTTVGEIEMAELAKSSERRQAAYDHYLTINSNGAIAPKVRYQRAHLAYEQGQTKEASNRFHEFASSNDCRVVKTKELSEFCTQAADLDLDSLVLLKEHSLVEARAAQYARAFPSRKVEYSKIYRTAVLKQVEQEKDSTAALNKLAAADLSSASDEEKIRIYKTRLIMAEKARDLNETRRSAGGLLKVKALSESDREYAMGRLVWAAEMSLDFNEALAITKRMKLKNTTQEERLMRLALLSELAGQNPKAYETEFLKISRSSEKKAIVRAKMVRSARNPVAEFAKHDAELQRYPSLYAPLALEIFSRSKDLKFAARVLKNRKVAQTPDGRLMSRQLFMNDFAKFEKSLRAHRLNGSSESLTRKTIVARMNLLGQAEKAGNQAIATRDWTLQLLTLSALSREHRRMHDDLMRLPVPKRLKGKDRVQYAQLVEAQAKGFMSKSAAIETKITQLWNDSETLTAKIDDNRNARPEVREIFSRELRALAQVAPSSESRQIENGLRANIAIPTSEMVMMARSDARSNPFSIAKLEKLRSLEQGRGREAMVAYLDARVSKLKESGNSGGRL